MSVKSLCGRTNLDYMAKNIWVYQ